MNAFQRFAARLFFGINSTYESANRSPRRANVPGSAPQDATLDLTPGVRSELVRRSRYLAHNSGFIREMVSAMALYSVGDGMRPQAESVNPEWNKKAEDCFNRWARHAELTGRFNLTQCQHLACKALDVDGEIFIHKVEHAGQLRIQLIEAHRIGDMSDTDTLIDGVRVDKNGSPISYRLLKDDGTYSDLAADHVLHIFDPDSPSQVRGCPSLQHSINHLLDEMELLALEKHAVKDNSDITRVLTTNRVNADDSDFRIGAPPQPAASDSGWLQRILGGKMVALQQGEDIKPFESSRPSPTFTGFCRIPWAYSGETRELRAALGLNALPSTLCGANEPVVYEEESYLYTPIPETVTGGGLCGYFQSGNYFADAEPMIRHLFAPLTAVDKIPGTAGIHITIGNDPFKFSRYRLTTAFFLQRAAARLSKDIREIVVFSDNPCEAMAMLVGIPGVAQYAFRVDRSKPCEQLRRMTAMQELVISNSALSWWAAWLGKPRKVIAPGGWFMHKAEQPPVFEDSPWIVL